MNTVFSLVIPYGTSVAKRFYTVYTAFARAVWKIRLALLISFIPAAFASRALSPKSVWINTAKSFFTGLVCAVEGFSKVTLRWDNTNLLWITLSDYLFINLVRSFLSLNVVQVLCCSDSNKPGEECTFIFKNECLIAWQTVSIAWCLMLRYILGVQKC